MTLRRLRFLVVVFLAACAAGRSPRTPGSGAPVWITVRNPSDAPVSVSVCGPAACSPFRSIGREREVRFTVARTGGTRAVVTAKRGDRVIDRQPVDLLTGERFRIVLNVP